MTYAVAIAKAHYALARLRIWQAGERTARHWRNPAALKRAQFYVAKWEAIFHAAEAEVTRLKNDPIVMYDSIDVNQIPAGAQAVAGYVGGHWPTFSSLERKFPNAKRLSIAVTAEENAECLDVENGDAGPTQAPGWVRRQHARGIVRPVVYANLSTMPQVIAALARNGITRDQYRVWTAHYTNAAHIEPGSDATQWTEHGFGRNLDISLCHLTFFD